MNKAYRNRGFVISLIIILSAMVFMICDAQLDSSWNDVNSMRGQVSYALSPASEEGDNLVTIKQLVYTNSAEYENTGLLRGYEWLNANQYDKFEYILSLSVLDPRSVYDTSLDGSVEPISMVNVGICLFDQSSADEDIPFYFMFGSREEFDKPYKKYLTFGEYNPNEYKYSYIKDDVGHLEDELFFTLTDEKAFLSFYDYYKSDVDKTKYLDSLDNICFEFLAGSEEYQVLYDFLLSESAGGEQAIEAESYSFTETLNLYKNVECVEIEPPTKEGYTFTGWYYDEACTQKYNGEPITEDTSLYAGWEINKYTVLFDCSVLEDPNDSNTIGAYNQIKEFEYGEIAECTPNVEVEGKDFLGWFFEDGTKYENSIVKSDMVLYGRWGVKEHTVTFDLNGGLYEDKDYIESISVSHGESISLPIPVKEGYKFIGWSMSGLNGPYCDEDWAITEALNLTAHWERNVFTVTFYVDNEVYKQIQVQEGQTLGNVISDMDLDIKRVVGYSNLNEETAASPINDFQIIDDMAVFLRDVQIENNVEDLKGKIVTFFEKNWIIIVSALGGVVVLALVIASIIIIVKRKH